jgi:hypothetical protein
VKTCITIIDLTRMHGDRVCIAGYTDDGDCVRPLFKHGNITEDWLWEDGSVVIFPFAVVELDLIANFPEEPHTEDWLIESNHKRFIGELSNDDQREWLCELSEPSVESIFGAYIHRKTYDSIQSGCWIRSGEGERSLGTIRASQIIGVTYTPKSYGKWDYRLTFQDQSGICFKLPVVDLAFRTYLDWARERSGLTSDDIADGTTTYLSERQVFLRIGLARGWDRFPDRCYLQITGVHTIPDLLNGRCFADFR